MRPDSLRFLGRALCYGLLSICSVALATSESYADNWQAPIYEVASPPSLVGIDKKNRTFNFFEKKSPLSLRYSYPCVTGQLNGDKMRINDLRTPEGIYFVEYKIANGLDFREYGGIAYTLNYPNPVDRLRGKTGHGIWIHSKGYGLSPTRGCIAIDLPDIAEVGPKLAPGTAVVVGEELKKINAQDNGSLEALRARMQDWTDAWASKSSAFFDFYDPGAYSLATENFTSFRANKERLFKALDWIKIYNREIHVLEGPGYWVTWADQYYTASNLSTEGIRRLYWQKGQNGDFRIVGMEWTPRNVGMAADFKKGVLVASTPSVIATDASSELPQAPRLDMPEKAGSVAADILNPSSSPEKIISSSLAQAVTAMSEKLVAVSEPLVPKSIPRTDPPEEFTWGIGKKLTEPVEQVQTSEPIEESKPDAQLEPDQSSQQPEKKQAPGITEKEIANAVEDWVRSYQNQDRTIHEFYDSRNYNRLPKAGIPTGTGIKTLTALLNQDQRQPWLKVIEGKTRIEIKDGHGKSEMEQLLVYPGKRVQGVRTQWWRKDETGVPRIVSETFQPRALGLEVNYLEAISEDVTAAIESWRKAWEDADLEKYMAHYAPDAIQQGRAGAANIKRQKQSLWTRVKPASVQLAGIRVALDNKGVRVDMNQKYDDSTGKNDKGVKTLLMRFDGKNWLIQWENWVGAGQSLASQR